MAYENNDSEQNSVYCKNITWSLQQKQFYKISFVKDYTKTIKQKFYFIKIIQLQKT